MEIQHTQQQKPNKICLGIASMGRPEVLQRTLDFLKLQSRLPDRIIVCVPHDQDLEGISPSDNIEFIVGPRGLPSQRNAIMDAAENCNYLVFFDDDFVPHADYLMHTEFVFKSAADIVMTTGVVIRDGILGPGLSFEEAQRLIFLEQEMPLAYPPKISSVYNSYGCNMGIDLGVARSHRIRFDEDLPLYAWWEDVDFSRRMVQHGRIVRVRSAKGVHLGTKKGRQSGMRLGYSQIANPVHLVRKGTCSPVRASLQITRNVIANIVKTIWSEPYVDRRGRVRGNIRAIGDLLAGRLRPGKVLEF